MKYQEFIELARILRAANKLTPNNKLKIGFNLQDFFNERAKQTRFLESIECRIDDAIQMAYDLQEIHKIVSCGYLSDTEKLSAFDSILEIFE